MVSNIYNNQHIDKQNRPNISDWKYHISILYFYENTTKMFTRVYSSRADR